jgi:sporulation protein YlmC with PRC-barrel domain
VNMHAIHPFARDKDEETMASQGTAALRLLGPSRERSSIEVEAPSAPTSIEYERGALVSAIDGLVGTLRQVIVDEDQGEVKALVVRMSEKNESVLVPPDLVDKGVGSALLLNVTKAQFAAGAGRSPRFDTRMFTAANPDQVANVIPLLPRSDARRSVVDISHERVETSNVLPASSRRESSSVKPAWWTRFGRGEGRRPRRVIAAPVDA